VAKAIGSAISIGGDDILVRTDRLNELEQTRLDYWNELVKHMRRHSSLIVFNKPKLKKNHQLRAKAETLGSGKIILVAQAIVSPESLIGVGIEISGSKEYYAALEKDKFKIQSEIGFERDMRQEFQWHPETKVRDIWLYQHIDFLEHQQWPEQHEWLCEKLMAFRTVLSPRIKELIALRAL
jgi:hypothetical protein